MIKKWIIYVSNNLNKEQTFWKNIFNQNINSLKKDLRWFNTLIIWNNMKAKVNILNAILTDFNKRINTNVYKENFLFINNYDKNKYKLEYENLTTIKYLNWDHKWLVLDKVLNFMNLQEWVVWEQHLIFDSLEDFLSLDYCLLKLLNIFEHNETIWIEWMLDKKYYEEYWTLHDSKLYFWMIFLENKINVNESEYEIYLNS